MVTGAGTPRIGIRIEVRGEIADLRIDVARTHGPIRQKECTYCNKCLLNDLANPLGCYEVSRYDGATFEEKWAALIKDVMSVFEPPLYR